MELSLACCRGPADGVSGYLMLAPKIAKRSREKKTFKGFIATLSEKWRGSRKMALFAFCLSCPLGSHLSDVCLHQWFYILILCLKKTLSFFCTQIQDCRFIRFFLKSVKWIFMHNVFRYDWNQDDLLFAVIVSPALAQIWLLSLVEAFISCISLTLQYKLHEQNILQCQFFFPNIVQP